MSWVILFSAAGPADSCMSWVCQQQEDNEILGDGHGLVAGDVSPFDNRVFYLLHLVYRGLLALPVPRP